MFDVGYLTDVGLKRRHNEDTILIDNKSNLYLIADGMGGHERGDVASKIVAETFLEQLAQHTQSIAQETESTIASMISATEEYLNRSVEMSTKKINYYADNKGITGTIGTTVAGAKYLRSVDKWIVFHLGDSRIYHLQRDSIRQISVDHSRYEELKAQDSLSQEMDKASKNLITKAIGNFKPYKLDTAYITLAQDDILLLCSDGISDVCSDDELLMLCSEYKNDLKLLSAQIKSLVYCRGAKDNLSIIVIVNKRPSGGKEK